MGPAERQAGVVQDVAVGRTEGAGPSRTMATVMTATSQVAATGTSPRYERGRSEARSAVPLIDVDGVGLIANRC